MNGVYITPCSDYEREHTQPALQYLLDRLNFSVTPGMKVAIKANLVTFLRPETAAVTHMSLIVELARILVERGAEVIVGDSPGGPFTKAALATVYKATGMSNVESVGARLNYNTDINNATFSAGVRLKKFTYTAWLSEADVIINFCKLKTHGMVGLSCAVKNMFGAIPGLTKPEYHYMFPAQTDFADMLIDINEYFKPALNICDAVVGMEGNGPTAGSPRYVGCLLASHSPYELDLVAASMIGITPNDAATLSASIRRGFISGKLSDINVQGNMAAFSVPDYKRQPAHGTAFMDKSAFIGGTIRKFLSPRPTLIREKCIGCGMCSRMCPAKAIEMTKNMPRIDRRRCIACFCCQEFCPKGALFVRRAAVARLFIRE